MTSGPSEHRQPDPSFTRLANQFFGKLEEHFENVLPGEISHGDSNETPRADS